MAGRHLEVRRLCVTDRGLHYHHRYSVTATVTTSRRGDHSMYRFTGFLAAAALAAAVPAVAQQPAAGGAYKVVKSARVGGEGGWDYIYADVDGRRLYIARGAV